MTFFVKSEVTSIYRLVGPASVAYKNILLLVPIVQLVDLALFMFWFLVSF